MAHERAARLTAAGRRRAWAVVVVGALVCIGTSAPRNDTRSAQLVLALEAGRTVHFVVRVSRAGVTHGDRIEMILRRSAGPAGELLLTPDDAALVADRSGGARATPIASIQVADLDALCPGDGDCDVGFDVEATPTATAFEVGIVARLIRFADGRFLFPEDRSLPADASIEIVRE